TGIGLAIARRLGTLGARIVIASRQSENLEHGWHSLRESGIDALAIQLDVRKPEQVDEMVERTVKHFGSLDILVNNAAGNFICRAEELSPNGWNAVIGIVLNGTFYCSRAVGRYMIGRKRGGSIVSILANYVWTGSPGTIHSAAAKAGVMSMTQTLAVEWAPHGIRVAWIAWIAVCVIWGTTYLGIRVSLETMPPMLMGGLRWVIAGGLLAVYLVARGEGLPGLSGWKTALILGFLMLVLGNGGV